jgi:chromosome segregation ATPase
MEFLDTIEKLDSTVVATLSAVFAGIAMKLFTKLANRRKDRLDEHVTLRKELREELDTVKDEMHKLRTEIDAWREKYYHQVETTNMLQAEIAALRLELSDYRNQTAEHESVFPHLEHGKDD